jgi:hypothetical protein
VDLLQTSLEVAGENASFVILPNSMTGRALFTISKIYNTTENIHCEVSSLSWSLSTNNFGCRHQLRMLLSITDESCKLIRMDTYPIIYFIILIQLQKLRDSDIKASEEVLLLFSHNRFFFLNFFIAKQQFIFNVLFRFVLNA